jgi:hypothetical protein
MQRLTLCALFQSPPPPPIYLLHATVCGVFPHNLPSHLQNLKILINYQACF